MIIDWTCKGCGAKHYKDQPAEPCRPDCVFYVEFRRKLDFYAVNGDQKVFK